jgi:hypothetical protein
MGADMGRGPGRVEREINKLLHEHPDNDFTVSEIARHVFGSSTPAQSRSVRRALKNVLERNPTWKFSHAATTRNHPLGSAGGGESVLYNTVRSTRGWNQLERLSEALENIARYLDRR